MTATSDDASDASTLCAEFQATVRRRGPAIALRRHGEADEITWDDYGQRVRTVAAGLAGLGGERGDTIALMLTNRPEFNIVDTAAYHLGMTPFSVYNTFSVEQVSHLFANAEAKVVVTEEQFLPKVLEAARRSRVEHVVTVDSGAGATLTLSELQAGADPEFDFDASWRSVEPDDVLTIIYTSGTTGPPKGVELTHRNILFAVGAGLDIIPGAMDGRVVSYLPDAHLVNRWVAHYLPVLTGATVTTVADIKSLLTALPDCRPTFFVAVPMLWYKLAASIEAAVAAERGLSKMIAAWAVTVGRRKTRIEQAGGALPASVRASHLLAESLVLSRLRAKIGLEAVQMAVSGAAPIAPDALEFILSLGIPVCEAWGMSETSALTTLNRVDDIRIGTVGTPVRGVEVALAEDGELLVRGPGNMRGYRGDPGKTAETLDGEGWIHTGDIGSVSEDGYISVIDRKKELIINSAGKNISPANIENTVKVQSRLIGSVVAIGDDRKYVTALIALDPEAAAAHAALHSISPEPAIIAADAGVRAAVQAAVDAANTKLARVEQIKRFDIVPTFWFPGGDELTPTMKLKRKPIAAKYSNRIDALYPSQHERGLA